MMNNQQTKYTEFSDTDHAWLTKTPVTVSNELIPPTSWKTDKTDKIYALYFQLFTTVSNTI